ncbi:Uncharacterised protein [Neisseria meningitidis]|nr:Uncharacterised protein [Neisseria meningitidis]
MYSNKLISFFSYCLYCAVQLSLMKPNITTVKMNLCYVLSELILPKAIRDDEVSFGDVDIVD